MMTELDQLEKGLFKSDDDNNQNKLSLTIDRPNLDFSDYVKTKRKDATKRQQQLAKEKLVRNLRKKSQEDYKNKVSSEKDIKNHYKNDKNLWYRLKSIAGNTTANVVSTAPQALGLLSTITAYPIAKIHSKITGDTDDVFLPMLQENLGIKVGDALERQVREDVDIDQIENMDRADQIINIGSMLVGPGAANGEKLLTSMIKPGLQITKEASKLGKTAQVATQVGLPTAMNEFERIGADQQGIFWDYSDPEQNLVRDILTPRKNSKTDDIYDVEYDENKEVEKENGLKKLAGTAALTGAAVLGARKSKYIQNLIKNHRDAQIAKRNSVIFSNTITPGEKVANTIDTKNITENALNKGFIDEKTANNLYRNTYEQTNNAFDTGTLYIGDNVIQTNKAPRWVLRDVQTIAANNPREAKTFNSFMEKGRQLQAKMFEYNRLNNTNFGLDDFLKKPGLMQTIKAPGDKSLSELYKDLQFLHKQIQKDGKFTQVLQDISDINNKTIDIALQTGEYTEQYANMLRKNRNLFGFNTYLPGINEQPELKGFNKVFESINNLTKNDPQYRKSKLFSFNKRSDNKTLIKADPWDVTFENNYKNSLKSLLDNSQKRELVKSLTENQKSRLESSINRITELQKEVNEFNSEEIGKKIAKLSDNVADDFENVKYLGEIDVNSGNISTNNNPLFRVLNKPKEELTKLDQSLDSKVGNTEIQDVFSAITNEKNKAKIIAIPTDNKVKYYQVDDLLGQIVQTNPHTASIFYNVMRGVTNKTKQMVTGKYNPFFSPITAAYTAADQLIGLRSMNKFLGTNNKAYKIKHIAGYTDALKYKTAAKKLDNIYKQLENGKLQRTPKVLQKINDLELKLRNSDINQIKATGANLQGRYPIDVYKTKAQNSFDDGFIINTPKALENLVKTVENSKLFNNDLINKGQTGLSYINYALTSLRDAPTLGLYKSMSKQFLRADGKIDANKIMRISRALDKYTATGNLTPPQTKLGNSLQAINDSFPYFSDMLSENAARVRQTGIGNVKNHVINLLDANVNLKNELKDITKGIVNNDFIRAGTNLVTPPVVLASIWNHANSENEAAYDALPDNYKSKGIVFVNVINGKPVVIPLTQSLMWLVTGIREGIVDPMLRLNENDYNRSQDFNEALKDTAKINFGISMPPLIGAGINMLGYRAPQSTELVGRGFENTHGLSGLELRTLDPKSKTYYSEGVFGPKTRAVVQTLFGNPGSAVTEAIDIAKSRKSLGQGLEAGLAKYTTTLTNLINPKATTWSATSGELYKKDQQLKQARHAKLTPEQQPVLNLINMFNYTKINPIKEEIKSLRKQIKDIQNTGKTTEGTDLSYIGTQKPIEDITKQIKLLQSFEIKQYETLDKILQQYYNTTYDQFMKGIK